jgi:hypothetical protein
VINCSSEQLASRDRFAPRKPLAVAIAGKEKVWARRESGN